MALPAPCKLLLLTLSIYMDNNGNCWPSIRELAERTDLTVKTVRKYIRLAIKKNLMRAKNKGYRGAKSQQMQYFATLSKTGGDVVPPNTLEGVTCYPRGGDVVPQRGGRSTPKHIKNKSLPIKDIYGEFKNVLLSDAELQKLQDKFGHEKAIEKIEKLSEYMESKGKKYNSHYATILSWVRKDTQKQETQTGPIYRTPEETAKLIEENLK